MRLMPEANWSSSWLPKGGKRVSRLPSFSCATACLIWPIGELIVRLIRSARAAVKIRPMAINSRLANRLR